MATHHYTITTERLQLRPLQKEDAGFIYALVNTEGWLQFIGDRNVHSEADAGRYIARILNAENTYYWVVEREEALIGVVTFLKRDYLDHFDLGFAFMPGSGKQGYAFESSKAVLDFVRSNLHHQTIDATTIPTNVHSIRLLEKLGFSFLKEREHNNEKLLIYRNFMK